MTGIVYVKKQILTLEDYFSILYIKITLRWIDEHSHHIWLLYFESAKLIYTLSYNSFIFDQISLIL